MYSTENKKFWNDCNTAYSQVWETKGRQAMSAKELNFIAQHLKRQQPKMILDIGIGNGRILQHLLANSPAESAIFGLDTSEQMVNICRSRFAKEPKIKQLATCDPAQQDICFPEKFDFATSIRVLKYNQNWPDMIQKVYNQLNPGGLYIFTMPNRISISGFSRDKFSKEQIPILYTSKSELKGILAKTGFKLIEFCAFSKLPNFLYHLSENKFYLKGLLLAEKTLDNLLGKSLFGRELFIVCQK